MADPRGLFGGSGKDNEDDKDIPLKPMGESAPASTASVESALTAVVGSLKAAPKGVAARTLFQQVRDALAKWRTLVNEQRWDELAQAIRDMLKNVDATTANIGHMADLPLVGTLQERLLALQGAAAKAQ